MDRSVDQTLWLPARHYGAGACTLASMDVPLNARKITVVAERDRWADTGKPVLSLNMEYSSDGGKTWSFMFSFKANGGEFKDPESRFGNASWFSFVLPEAGHPQRKVRGTAQIFSTIKTSIAVRFE